MRAAWSTWQKLSAELTPLPKLIRLLNDRFAELSRWVDTAVPMEAMAAMPTSGTWPLGYFVQNTTPVVLGGAGSRYTVLGWRRITAGSSNVLNADWVECRVLTGT